MKCSNCQAELLEGARFCSVCGTSVAAVAPVGIIDSTPTRAAWSVTSGLRLSRPVLLGAVSVIALVALAAVALAVVPRLLAGPEQLLYIVQEDGPTATINTLAVMRPDGSDNLEVAHSRSGLFISALPDKGRLLAYYENSGEEWELVLTSLDGLAPLLTEERGGGGFSPDGRYFAYRTTNDDGENLTLRVVDEEGSEIIAVPDVVFADFFPDSQRILVVEADNEGTQEGVAWVDVASGNMTHITDLDADSGWPYPLVTPDGNQVYYYTGGELLVMPVGGGPADPLFEFDSDSPSFFFSPARDFLVMVDGDELYLLRSGENRPIRLDSEVAIASRDGFTLPVHFSPDNGLVAYTTGESGDLALMIVGVDGRNRRRITDGLAWVPFAFSSNGRQIAYVEIEESDEPGTLYIANVDGSDKVRLDTDVWSFHFAPDGRSLIYSKSDFNGGDWESELFRIRLDGEDQELVLEAQDGVISILAWLK